jgi:hypothetical protein
VKKCVVLSKYFILRKVYFSIEYNARKLKKEYFVLVKVLCNCGSSPNWINLYNKINTSII